MKKILIPIAISIAMVSAIFVGCSKTPVDPTKTVVAEIGQVKIMESDLNLLFTPTQKELDTNYANVKPEDKKEVVLAEKSKLLDNMVDNVVLLNKAMELKLFADDKEIETAIDSKVASLKTYYKTEDAFSQSLKDKGLTLEILRKTLKQQIVYDKVYQYIIKDVAATEDEISKYYQDNLGLFTEQPNTMDVYHILLRTEAEAKEVKDKLDKGEDFAALAKQYSVDNETKNNGGYMGKLATDNVNYDREFVKTVIAMDNNSICNPFQDAYGYEIVKIMNKTDIKPLALDKVKDKVKSILLYERKSTLYNNALKDWKKDIKITYYKDNIEK